jgi:hypothetical protein
MAMPIRPTLGELRESLLRRVGLAAGGTAPANVLPIIDERIRQAERMLHTRIDFTHLWERMDVPLTAGVNEYDWPDNVEVGDLRWISAVNQDGYEARLNPGMRPIERNSAYPTPQTDQTNWSQPLIYTIQNQVIRIGPTPDETWVRMVYEYYLAPGPMVDPEERCAIDPEALLMQAEILTKQHFGMPGIEPVVGMLDEYLKDLQAKQGDGDGFQLGGRQSIRIRPWRRNRVAENGRNGPFSRNTLAGSGGGWYW